MPTDNQEKLILDGDRSPENLTQSSSISKRITYIFVLACALLLILFLGWKYFAAQAEKRRAAAEEATRIDTSRKVEQSLPPITITRPPSPPPPPPQSTPQAPTGGVSTSPQPQLTPPPPVPKKKELTPDELAMLRKMNSPVSMTIQNKPEQLGSGDAGEERRTSTDNSLSRELVGAATPKALARTLGDRNFLLTKGTFIEAVMETAMSSDLPGMIKALVTSDVYSTNGKVVLLERGTRLVGEFKGQLRNGQARVFCLWTRAETPKGVIINLDSGAADALGRSGLDSDIDNHWGLRLGAALLLSTWSDLLQAVIDSQRNYQGDNNYITYDNSSRAAQDMATEALRQYINIPPTLLKNQGDPVRVFVARDLDFKNVYRLGVADNPGMSFVPVSSLPVSSAVSGSVIITSSQ